MLLNISLIVAISYSKDMVLIFILISSIFIEGDFIYIYQNLDPLFGHYLTDMCGGAKKYHDLQNISKAFFIYYDQLFNLKYWPLWAGSLGSWSKQTWILYNLESFNFESFGSTSFLLFKFLKKNTLQYFIIFYKSLCEGGTCSLSE